MAQLRRGLPEIRAQGGEVVQVTHTTVDEARRYARFYAFDFPYLCDPGRVVHDRYGLALDFEQRLEQLAPPLGGIARRKRQSRGEHVDRVVAAIGADQRQKAARDERRAYEEHAGDRHLPGHNQRARARHRRRAGARRIHAARERQH